ncbi:MAG: hypothetical protein KC425_25670 [Anaerolineales bacterium]|nr:hypothetical protein [Anaerolineales bacterium]
MNNLSVVLHLYNRQEQRVADIVLNGYNISAGGPLGSRGAMRSFKVIEGDLWDQWHAQANLVLRHESGQASDVRIAALPVDDESFGLIEFL